MLLDISKYDSVYMSNMKKYKNYQESQIQSRLSSSLDENQEVLNLPNELQELSSRNETSNSISESSHSLISKSH